MITFLLESLNILCIMFKIEDFFIVFFVLSFHVSLRSEFRVVMSVAILYKYSLVVRVICEKYRMRGEANFTSRLSDEGSFPVLETGIFRK